MLIIPVTHVLDCWLEAWIFLSRLQSSHLYYGAERPASDPPFPKHAEFGVSVEDHGWVEPPTSFEG